jgi:NCS1 family nucleobase:cation symporter-1
VERHLSDGLLSYLERRLDIPALSDPHQRYGFWNLYAITLYIVGVLIQLPFIENPLFHGSLTWMFAGNDVSWMIGWFGTGVLYYALRRFDRRSLPAQSLSLLPE